MSPLSEKQKQKLKKLKKAAKLATCKYRDKYLQVFQKWKFKAMEAQSDAEDFLSYESSGSSAVEASAATEASQPVVGEKLIGSVNKLQEGCAELAYEQIELPQIVAVGGQSSGKSSVLESIIGESLLPGGTDIVTRMPLVLQLNTYRDGPPYGVFGHEPNKRYMSFADMRSEIERYTSSVCGDNKGISATPIILKIYSPSVLKLTLVDLPGITRVAVGDQDQDIGRQIEDMVTDYVSNPRVIILAVTPANQDIANSDAIAIAKKVDPQGERTIGVLTKLDIMDKGTSAIAVLQNEKVPLKHGFIGVVNRSQEATDQGVDVKAAREAEARFFANHKDYRKIKDRQGTAYLCEYLSTVLTEKIKAVLPQLSFEVTKLIASKEAELACFARPEDRYTFLLNTLQKFATKFRQTLDGQNIQVSRAPPAAPKTSEGEERASPPEASSSAAPPTAAPGSQLGLEAGEDETTAAPDEIIGGARIEHVFRVQFQRLIKKHNTLERLTDPAIANAIINAGGTGGGLFIPNDSFHALIKDAIGDMLEPSLRCAALVHEELQSILTSLIGDYWSYPDLQSHLQAACTLLMQSLLNPTKNQIELHVQMELARINLVHPDFLGNSKGYMDLAKEVEQGRGPGAVPSPALAASGMFGESSSSRKPKDQRKHSAPATDPLIDLTPDDEASWDGSGGLQDEPTDTNDSALTPRQQVDVKVLRSLLNSYFGIVQKNVVDYVPKCITLMLVDKAKEELHSKLDETVRELEEADVDRLLGMSDQAQEKYIKIQRTLKTLREANAAIDKIKSMRLG